MQINATATSNGRFSKDNRAMPLNGGRITTDISPAKGDPRLDKLRQSIDANKSVTQAMRSDDHSSKAQAKARLDAVKSQLAFLEQWGFPAEVVARIATELGRIVTKAASQFTSSEGGGITSPGTSEAPPSNAAALSEAIEGTSKGMGAAKDDAGADDEDGLSKKVLPEAYRHMIDAAALDANASDDAETAAEFGAVARRLKALLEQALQELRG